MEGLEIFKYLGCLKMRQLNKIEKMAMEEIEQLKGIKSEELNKLEKIKLEEIEHLEQIKLSEMERFKNIKIEEKAKYFNMKYINNLDIESFNEFLEKFFNELEAFSKNEMENLERIGKDEIERLEKIKNEGIEQHKNFLKKEIAAHKIHLMTENLENKSYKKILIENFKKNKGRSPPPLSGPPIMKNMYKNNIKIKVIFEEINSESNNEIRHPPFVIECSLNDKIAQLIEKYNEKIGDHSPNKIFLYKNRLLLPGDLVKQLYLSDGSIIQVKKV